MSDYTYIITDRPDLYPPEPQYRFRVRGHPYSWNDGDEFVEVPAECPSISTGGCGVLGVGDVGGFCVSSTRDNF